VTKHFQNPDKIIVPSISLNISSHIFASDPSHNAGSIMIRLTALCSTDNAGSFMIMLQLSVKQIRLAALFSSGRR
jgi:hypothetical protein